MKTRQLVSSLLLAFTFSLNIFPSAANAQGETPWSPDIRVPGYLDDTFTPFLLSDPRGFVHAFASQWVENVYRRRAVVYRKWMPAGGWTRPVDIILAPSGDAEFLSAFLDDSHEILHILFMAGEQGNLGVYYSHAPVGDAEWAPAWSEPVLVGEAAAGVNSAAIHGDRNGGLFVIYSGVRDGSGVYVTSSQDNGHMWSHSEPIFLTHDSNLIAYSIRASSGDADRLHVVWAVATSLGVYESIYYVGMDAKSPKWDTPVMLEKRVDLQDFFGPSFPVIVDNGKYVIVMYNSGNPLTGRPVDVGRPILQVRLSDDGGRIWSGAIDPFPFHVGHSGEHTLVIDSNKVVHALFIMRIDRLVDGQYRAIGGIWHSQLVDQTWSSPDRYVPTLAPAYIRGVVSQGNVLMATWIEDLGVGQDGVWYFYRTVKAPALTPVPASHLSSAPASAFPTSTAIGGLPTQITLPVDVLADPSGRPGNPIGPIVSAVMIVAVVLIGTIVIYSSSSRRK
jgi:hypothetical protein